MKSVCNSIFWMLAAGLLLFSCTRENFAPEAETDSAIESVPFITVYLDNEEPEATQPETKTSHTYSAGKLTAAWKLGDKISISPGRYNYPGAGVYEKVNDGTGTVLGNKFKVSTPVGEAQPQYGIFYPGDLIKSEVQFRNIAYDSQIQSKSDPMAHMAQYHTMYKIQSDYSTVTFSGSDFRQSSCMKMNLSGMTFSNPDKITLTVMAGTGESTYFYGSNAWPGYYIYGGSDVDNGNMQTSSISMGLSGYGSETSLEAYMMMSCNDVELHAGNRLRVSVSCSDGTYYSDINVTSDMTLKGGCCHRLSTSGTWYKMSALDGTYEQLQIGSKSGKAGFDIIIIGDGYTQADLESSTYEDIMNFIKTEFLAKDPIQYYKDWFNVFYVRAVSHEGYQSPSIGENGASVAPSNTALSVQFTAGKTSLSGDDTMIMEYAKKALAGKSNADNRLAMATIIVSANLPARAGTCSNYFNFSSPNDWGTGHCIAYCALGRSDAERRQLIHHEAAGHGFGKLADEYTTSTYYLNPTSIWDELDNFHQIGMYRNADKFVDAESKALYPSYSITDEGNVYWSAFFGKSAPYYNYETKEDFGVWEGSYALHHDFCRPTQTASKSIMNENTGIFNVISRYAIYYRIHKMNEESGTFTSLLGTFLDWDKDHFSYPADLDVEPIEPNYVTVKPLPLAPPVNISGHWENGYFIND